MRKNTKVIKRKIFSPSQTKYGVPTKNDVKNICQHHPATQFCSNAKDQYNHSQCLPQKGQKSEEVETSTHFQKEESGIKFKTAKVSHFSKKENRKLFDSDAQHLKYYISSREQYPIFQPLRTHGTENQQWAEEIEIQRELVKETEAVQTEEVSQGKLLTSKHQRLSEENMIFPHLLKTLRLKSDGCEMEKKKFQFSSFIQHYSKSRQELKKKLYEPIPKNMKAICIFKRLRSLMSESYQLVLEGATQPILFCQNQRGSIGANFYIGLAKEISKESSAYLGKLRGNYMGSEYLLYDTCQQEKREQLNCPMAKVEYETNFFGWKGSRKIKVTLPNVNFLLNYNFFKLSSGLRLVTMQPPLITKYRSRQLQWKEGLGVSVIGFDKIKERSVRNLVLAKEEDDVENCLVFGKVGQHSFSLQAVYPLSLFQAFGIAISEFGFKMHCE